MYLLYLLCLLPVLCIRRQLFSINSSFSAWQRVLLLFFFSVLPFSLCLSISCYTLGFFFLDGYVKLHEIGENVEMMKLLDIHVFWVAILHHPHPTPLFFPPSIPMVSLVFLSVFTSFGWWTWISSMENYAKIWYTKLIRWWWNVCLEHYICMWDLQQWSR